MLSALAVKKATDEENLSDPLEILTFGFNFAKGILGSSTAVVITVTDDSGEEEAGLKGINLGDSGYMIVRENKLFYASPSQTHRRNMPYQLGSNNRNVPSDGITFSTKLKKGDVIVLVSDGVLDNMVSQTIVDIVAENSVKKSAQEVAQQICNVAYEYSKSELGKQDDISTMVLKYNPTTKK